MEERNVYCGAYFTTLLIDKFVGSTFLFLTELGITGNAAVAIRLVCLSMCFLEKTLIGW